MNQIITICLAHVVLIATVPFLINVWLLWIKLGTQNISSAPNVANNSAKKASMNEMANHIVNFYDFFFSNYPPTKCYNFFFKIFWLKFRSFRSQRLLRHVCTKMLRLQSCHHGKLYLCIECSMACWLFRLSGTSIFFVVFRLFLEFLLI